MEIIVVAKDPAKSGGMRWQDIFLWYEGKVCPVLPMV